MKTSIVIAAFVVFLGAVSSFPISESDDPYVQDEDLVMLPSEMVMIKRIPRAALAFPDPDPAKPRTSYEKYYYHVRRAGRHRHSK